DGPGRLFREPIGGFEGQPGLAGTARTAECNQPDIRVPQPFLYLGDLALPAEEPVESERKLFRLSGVRPDGREVAPLPVREVNLEDAVSALVACEPIAAKLSYGGARLPGRVGKSGSSGRTDHLTGMCRFCHLNCERQSRTGIRAVRAMQVCRV